VIVSIVEEWPWARHPHQTPSWYRAFASLAICVRATDRRGGVIVPLAVDGERAASLGYGGPIAWGDAYSQMVGFQRVMSKLLELGIKRCDLRWCPTESHPVIEGSPVDLGPTIVIPLARDTKTMWDALHPSVRRDVTRAQRAGYRSGAWLINDLMPDDIKEAFNASYAQQFGINTDAVDQARKLAADGRLDVWIEVVTVEGEFAAGQIVVQHAGTLEVMTATCAPEHRHMSPLKVADWSVIARAGVGGASVVHVGGAASTGDVEDGLIAYKRRLGGEERRDVLYRIDVEHFVARLDVKECDGCT